MAATAKSTKATTSKTAKKTDYPASRAPNTRRNLFEAVAGRYFSGKSKDASNGNALNPKGAYTLRSGTLTPEEVLFSAGINPPERYEEDDIYFANRRDLPNDGEGILPDSDLLKAVHEYTAAFYEAMAMPQPMFTPRGKKRRQKDDDEVEEHNLSKLPMKYAREEDHEPTAATMRYTRFHDLIDERSMDGTALLAFGILLEEAAREALGENGELVFTEAVDSNYNPIKVPAMYNHLRDNHSRLQGGDESRDDSQHRPLPKRPRLASDDDT